MTGHVSRVMIVAVESEAPYDVGVFEVSQEALAAGDEDVARLLRRVAECRASVRWPGRYPDVTELDLPGWAKPRDEGDLADLGLYMGTDET
jgi:hypothetical protein